MITLIIKKSALVFLSLSFATGLSTIAFLSMAHATDNEREILYWVAPMDPNYRRDKPGKSPMGMDLIPFYASANGDSSIISISPVVVQNLGVRTQAAESGRLWRAINTVAYVNYDESKVRHVHLRTEGWIENLAVESEGDGFKKGDFLFDLYSPKLVNAQDELISALITGNTGLIHASKQRLGALGISASHIKQLEKTRKVKQRIAIYAHHDGVVSKLSVREGMFVKPEMEILTLVDLSSVWLLAEVFERQTAWVEVGQMAEVRFSYLPGKTWTGKIDFIYPELDPKTRTLKVRLRFDNPGELLKPNMFARVKIYGGATQETIIIPVEGLIRTGIEERVIIALGDGRFEAREVVSGIESGNYVEIIRGVQAEDNIVVSGQFLIDSEASMRGSLRRLTDAGDGNAMIHGDMNQEAAH